VTVISLLVLQLSLTVTFLEYIALMENDFWYLITVTVLGLAPVLVVILLFF
jgi:hypothetical protein